MSTNTHPNTTLSSDRAVERLAGDRLGYAPFARALARSITGMLPSDGIVLAIHGPWGSGKTSAVNMTVEAIYDLQQQEQEDHKIVVVRFNPWWFSGQEDLAKSFFAEISACLEKKVSEKVVSGFKNVARKVAKSKDMILAGLDLVPGGMILKGVASDAIDIAAGVTASSKSLAQERAELCDLLREEEKRILVIIDDVDRLTADEARQIFRTVKSLGDLPNVIHLLVFDRENARLALEGVSALGGADWLDKIIQGSFDLPPIQKTDLRRLFLDGLNQIIGDHAPEDMAHWRYTFREAIDPWLKTPRDVGRVLNAVAVSWPVVADEVNLADFVALETLRLFEPALHTFIRHNRERLTGAGGKKLKEYDPNLGDDLLGTVRSSSVEDVKRALQRLFPKLQDVWDDLRMYVVSHKDVDRYRRVCSSRRFHAYFGFGVTDEVLTKAEMDNFLAIVGNAVQMREEISSFSDQQRKAGGTKAAVLLDEISSHAASIEERALLPLAKGLIASSDLLTLPADNDTGELGLPATWRYFWALGPVLERLSEGERFKVLSEGLEDGAPLDGINFVVSVIAQQLGRYPDARSERAREPLLSEERLDKLEQSLRLRFREMARTGSLLQAEECFSYLLQWSRIAGEDEVKAWSASELSHSKSALLLAKAVTGSVSTSGDESVITSPKVTIKAANKVVDFNELSKKVSALKDDDNLSQENAKIIADFELGAKAHQW